MKNKKPIISLYIILGTLLLGVVVFFTKESGALAQLTKIENSGALTWNYIELKKDPLTVASFVKCVGLKAGEELLSKCDEKDHTSISCPLGFGPEKISEFWYCGKTGKPTWLKKFTVEKNAFTTHSIGAKVSPAPTPTPTPVSPVITPGPVTAPETKTDDKKNTDPQISPLPTTSESLKKSTSEKTEEKKTEKTEEKTTEKPTFKETLEKALEKKTVETPEKKPDEILEKTPDSKKDIEEKAEEVKDGESNSESQKKPESKPEIKIKETKIAWQLPEQVACRDITSTMSGSLDMLDFLNLMYKKGNYLPNSRAICRPNSKIKWSLGVQMALTLADESCGVELSTLSNGNVGKMELRKACMARAIELGLIGKDMKGNMKKVEFYDLMLKGANLSMVENLETTPCEDVTFDDWHYSIFASAKQYDVLRIYKYKGQRGYCLPKAPMSLSHGLRSAKKALEKSPIIQSN